MKKIVARCLEEQAPTMLLGEGWELPTALPAEKKATIGNARQLLNIRFFNDYFRDTIKGSLFSDDQGFVNGSGRFIERMPSLVTGSCLEEFGSPFVPDVSQTINYVECHDNHTLWDRLLLTNPHETEIIRKKIHQLATGITLLSQGVPFLHAGQEWFRTKYGDGNSYISSDQINQLDWNKREQEQQYIEFVKSLILLRRQYPVFRLRSKEEIRKRIHIVKAPAPVFGYTLLGENEDFTVYVNPSNDMYPLHLPSSGKWKIMISNLQNHRDKHEINGEYTTINGYELLVLKKSFYGK
ncbi:hypothetical protein OEV98_00420 [Caldibacillus lycopersici]|uniref:Pullulanase n=1 Tax=Perspicuibacillus lycopersici TaxID=1325689 RepID=A0AAE3IP85_9BACI|nr:hypothetical protein [Perspicuibacillus lycopersici]MCU9612020.1 hypothetical protein [Perspicuibacillus lycopersici]